MENHYEASDIVDPAKPRGAPLLAILFFLLSAFCAFIGIGEFVVASLFKAGFFSNSALSTPVWQVASRSGIVLVVAICGVVTGQAFRRGRYKFAAALGCVTLVLFAYLVYRT